MMYMGFVTIMFSFLSILKFCTTEAYDVESFKCAALYLICAAICFK